METVTLEHLDNILSKPAFVRCPKISYQTLLKMKRLSDWKADAAFEDEVWPLVFKYTKISLRILQAMINHPNKFVNEEIN